MADWDTEMGGGPREFPQTTWGLVSRLKARHPERQEGLEALCRRYWKPIYSYVRRGWRKPNDEAKDLTQAFFLDLVEGHVLEKFQPDVGSFRSFLKGVLRNFLRNHEQALRRLKRGGGARTLPLDELFTNPGEVVPADGTTPEEAFDHAWVDQLIEDATERTRAKLVAAGHEVRFRAFEAYELAPAGSQPTYADVAQQLGVKTSDVRNSLFAVREALRSEIRAALRETVATSEQLEAEWRELFTQ